MDTVRGQRILLGEVKREHMADSVWFMSNYDYEPIPDEILHKISESSVNKEVDVYFGSWCEDSQRWVPVFMNIVDNTNLRVRTSFVGLPRSKQEREKMAPGINIVKVPTFIFKMDGKEIGRIIENPVDNFSREVLNILQRN
jgi:hypothetical protein